VFLSRDPSEIIRSLVGKLKEQDEEHALDAVGGGDDLTTLSLDDTIDQYIKGIPNGDQITLRQMANMTSGVANYTENEQFQEDLVSDA